MVMKFQKFVAIVFVASIFGGCGDAAEKTGIADKKKKLAAYKTDLKK